MYNSQGVSYQLRLAAGMGAGQQLTNGAIRLSPNASGRLAIILKGRNATANITSVAIPAM